MARANQNLLSVPPSYLFRDIGDKVNTFKEANPNVEVISLGIGDTVQPLDPQIAAVGSLRCTAMGTEGGYAGYPGDAKSLREGISMVMYKGSVPADHIFISTGAKEDSGGIGDLFGPEVRVLITDPVYPVYLNASIMYGKDEIHLIEAGAHNNFLPGVPDSMSYSCMIFLCFPNNPTGQVADRKYLKRWVDFAIKTKSVIIFDAAYAAFIQDPEIPRSIFEIDGAQKVAIEIGSFSKSHGFTGLRVSWTAIGTEVELEGEGGKMLRAKDLWARRQAYRSNGVAHPLVAMAGEAISDAGMAASRRQVKLYMENTSIMLETLRELGFDPAGGVNAPYIWCPTPDGMSSWAFFDRLLNQCGVVCTPGEGFGSAGAKYFRLSAFAHGDKVADALERILDEFQL